MTGSGTSLGGGSNPTASYALVVKIVDANGNPVQGASVSQGTQSLLSDSNGLVNFSSQQAGSYTIQASASGCTSTSQPISLTSDHSTSNPVQISMTCGNQQTSTTQGGVNTAQVEQLIYPILGFTLLAIAGVAFFEQRKRQKKRTSGA